MRMISGLDGEWRKLHDGAAFQGRLMGTQANTGPVGRLPRIREWITVIHQGGEKLVRQVWMGPAVSGTLREAQMRLLPEIVHAFGGKALNWLWQQLRVIRRLHRLGDLWFRQLGAVHHQWFMLDERPFDGNFR